MEDNFLVFDLWASFGHFKKPYTTTSPLTYSIPTRTGVSGIIAAVIGLKKSTYAEYFTLDRAKIGIALKRPVKKVRIGENLINTKRSMGRIINRTQIKMEFLKDPCYRIYFSHTDRSLYEKLKGCLAGHCTVYTVSMGLSENLADFCYIGEFTGRQASADREYVEIHSIIPKKILEKSHVDFNNEGEYFTETIPLEMQNNREITEYGEVLFERNSRVIRTRIREYVRIDELGENFCILR